jgi:hypothetical protein
MLGFLTPDTGLSTAQSVLAPDTRVTAPAATKTNVLVSKSRVGGGRARALILQLLRRGVGRLRLGTAEAIGE